jgi:hypothetical protein
MSNRRKIILECEDVDVLDKIRVVQPEDSGVDVYVTCTEDNQPPEAVRGETNAIKYERHVRAITAATVLLRIRADLTAKQDRLCSLLDCASPDTKAGRALLSEMIDDLSSARQALE